MFFLELMYELQFGLIHAITKGIAKEIHNALLFKLSLRPFRDVATLVITRNAILGKGNDFTLMLLHMMICHLIFAEIHLNDKNSACIAVLFLIDKHGCESCDQAGLFQFYEK